MVDIQPETEIGNRTHVNRFSTAAKLLSNEKCEEVNQRCAVH